MRSAATPHAAAAAEAQAAFEQQLRMHAHKQPSQQLHLHPAPSYDDKQLDVLERCTPSPNSEIPLSLSGESKLLATAAASAAAVATGSWMSPTAVMHPPRTSTPTPTTASRVQQYRRLSLPSPHTAASTLSPHTATSITQCSSTSTSAGPPSGCSSVGSSLSSAGGLLLSCDSTPMSMLRLDFLSPSSSPPPSCSSSTFASSSSMSSRSTVSQRTSHGLFSPNTMSERNTSSAFSASEEAGSDGDSSSSFSSAEPIATTTPGFVHSTGGPSPTVRAGVCMRAGILAGVPSNQVSEMRSKRRRQLLHQSQLATIRSSSGSSNSAIAASSPFTAPAAHPSSLDVALEHVPAPLFPSPSPHSGCSDSTLSPSPMSSDGKRRSSFITPYPSPVNRTAEEVAALKSSAQQMLEAMRLQMPSAAAAFEDASATPQPQLDVCVVSPQVLTSLTLPLRSLKLRASGSNGSNGSPSGNPATAVSTPTGSPLAEMTEEQRKHINSLVRKSKPKRSSKRSGSGRRGGPPPASSSNSRLAHASPPFGGKIGRTPGSRPSPSLLSVPFVSPISSSPMSSPRGGGGPQLGASPRNFNLFKLKLPGMSPSLSSVMSGDETPSSLALTSASSVASASGLLRTPDTDETDEEDFAAIATPGNAGLGAEEDGEIVLCGIHGQGSTTHRRGNSADTTDSENESTPGSNTHSSILTLLPITETSPTLSAVTASVDPAEVNLEPVAPSRASLPEPTFDSSFDTSALEASAAKPVVQLQASAAQVVAEASLSGTVLASPPLQATDSDRLPELAAAFAASKRKVSRRATMSGCEGITAASVAASAAGGSSNRKRSGSTVPYDFSPAGHLIIDGFEISRKGVTHTPDVSARRLSIRGSSSCCTSPSSKVVPSAALLSAMRARSGSINPETPFVESVRSAIAGEPADGDNSALPRPLFSTLSAPNSLTNTPTLLGRRLSIVKLQQQREKEKAAAKPRHRRYGSAEVSPTSQLSQTTTPEPAAASLVPSSSFDSVLSMDSLNSLFGDDACTSSSSLKSSFGPKFKAPKPASLGIELRLNDLVRLGEIGRGANGAVHKAVHLPTLKIVALKSVSIFDKDERHQFLQELHAFLNVQSTQCVKFVGACFAEGMITMALEYLNRGSIDHVVERSGPFDEPSLKVVLQQLLLGIQDLHTKNFAIHRDIKPANILINNLGVVKVSDFGLMKQLDFSADGSGAVEPCSKFVGTMLYLAPERIRGDPFSFPSDIYAVGLCAIFMALGELQQVPKDYWGLVQGATAADGPTPGLPDDGRFSRELRELVGHMMCKDPKDRWTAAQLLEHPWFTSEAASDPAAGGAAGMLSPSKLVDPLEHWPGRQLEDPQPEELSILIEAVIKRWYAMPTREVMSRGGEAAQAFLQQFEPSSFDLARFTHLAQQLGWHAQPVITAFTEAIREKINAALEEIAAASSSSASETQAAGEQQQSTSTSIFSSAASSIRSSLCNAFGGASGGSQDNSAAPSPLLASASFNLPRGGSRSALLSNSSRSLNSSPVPACLSPTSSSISSRPPKVPQRSHSPSGADAMPSLSLGAAYPGEPHSPVQIRRTSGRTLSSSGRRESFHMRAAEAAALVGQTVAAGSQPSSRAASPATRSLGLGGGAASDSTHLSMLPHPHSSRPLSIGSAADLIGAAATGSRGSPLLPPF